MSGAQVNPSSNTEGQSPAQPSKVLVAEDEHLVAADLTDHLAQLGIEVVGPASDGQRAVDLARQQGPDLALLDIRMPAMDGLAAAEVLFNELGIPIVIVSAHTDADYINRGAEIGVFGYILKPITIDDLRANLTIAWSRYQQQTHLRDEVDNLKTALENRKVIERAKGVLMDKLGLGEADAMRRLQKQARDSRQPLAELAHSVLESEKLFRDEPSNDDR